MLIDLQEIVQFARRMVREAYNGFLRARHWLRAMGYSLELQVAILTGA